MLLGFGEASKLECFFGFSCDFIAASLSICESQLFAIRNRPCMIRTGSQIKPRSSATIIPSLARFRATRWIPVFVPEMSVLLHSSRIRRGFPSFGVLEASVGFTNSPFV